MTIWQGTYDTNGCSPYIGMSQHSEYRIRQGTMAQAGELHGQGARFYVNPDNGDWGTSWIWLNSYRNTNAYASGLYYDTVNLTPNWEDPRANLMPIIGRILDDTARFAVTDGSTTYIRVDTNKCVVGGRAGMGAYYKGLGRICLVGEIPPPSNSGITEYREDNTSWKYVVAHEIGHRIADLHSGVKNLSAYASSLSGLPKYCNCYGVTGIWGSPLHCLTSRDKINIGQGEGFADFFASAVFNSRTRTQGSYVYQKESWRLNSSNILDVFDPPNAYAPYVVASTNSNTGNPFDRWMERRCSASMANQGVELDWLKFFWELWTDPNDSAKFNVERINQVFQEKHTVTLRYWNNLINTATWPHSDTRRTLFINKGQLAGVNK